MREAISHRTLARWVGQELEGQSRSGILVRTRAGAPKIAPAANRRTILRTRGTYLCRDRRIVAEMCVKNVKRDKKTARGGKKK